MMEIILFWMTGALISGFLCRLLSLPISIGFIAAGYFFVKVDLHDKSDILEIPSELGIALLLFSLGLKLKPSYFLNKDIIGVFVLHSLILCLIYYILWDQQIEAKLKIGLCLALTISSTLVAAQSLETRKELNTFHGRLTILILVFQDLLALLLLLFFSITEVNHKTLYLFLIPIFLPFMKLVLTKISGSDELVLIAALVIALLLGMTVFKTLGLTGELGALVMGVLFSGHKTAEKLSNKIWSLREVLLLGFFISLGMKLNFDPGIIKSCLLLLGLLFIKAIVLFFLLLVFKLRAYTSFLIAVSLSTFSEFTLIIVTTWHDVGWINEDTFSLIVIAVCLSFIIGAILNKFAHQIFIPLEEFLKKFERKTYHPDEEPHTCGEATIMILGMGRVGAAIFENLSNKKFKVVGFDADMDLVIQHRKIGKRVTFADAEDPSFWSQLRFGKLEAIILALPEFSGQNWCTLQARKNGFSGKIIIPARSQGDPSVLKASGADNIYDTYQSAGLGITEMLANDKKVDTAD